MKIVTIVGARPQFVKAAALTRAINQYNHLHTDQSIQHFLVHTGQHYDYEMSDVFFKELGLPWPHKHLGIGGLTHGAMTGRMLEQIETILAAEQPSWVVVFGDTNSTLAGSLAATKMHIKVAHVEAGLRSHNRQMPEEINRIIADHCADMLFTPTLKASEQLINEGIDSSRIFQVGDVMQDNTYYYSSQRDPKDLFHQFDIQSCNYILATIHRNYNTDEPERLIGIVNGLSALSKHCPVVFPIHPRTKAAMDQHKISFKNDAVKIIEPLGFLDMLALERHAKLIITDSGGVQKEAYFCRVPCITVRTETEWVELLEIGANILADASVDGLCSAYDAIQNRIINWDSILYGNGNAADLIVEALMTSSILSARHSLV